MRQQTNVYLSIRDGYKGVPYGRSDERPDGSKNHGFKPLRESLSDIALIPEAQDVPALKNALTVLNDPASIFFTVGCEKAFGQTNSGHWVNGYLELAFNYVELLADAQFYFKLFFAFSQLYWKADQRPSVRYNFELQAAHFMKANAGGMTMTVWIGTGVSVTKEAAQSEWERGLDTVVGFLQQQLLPPESHYTRIY
jgi:hypothetical protein